MEKTTRSHIESAFVTFCEAANLESGTEDGQFFLEWWGQKARIVKRFGGKGGISTSFGHTYYTKKELYNLLQFAINTIRIMKGV